MARTRARRPRRAGGLTAVVCAAAVTAFAPPAQAAPPEGPILGAGAPGSVSGSYLVTLRAGVPAPSAAGREVAAQYGVTVSHTYGTVVNGFAVRADERQARRLAADPRVASVAQDTRVVADGTRPDPPWGLDRVDRPALPLDRAYTAPDSGGKGVTVYVIDTGVRVSHRDFGGRASYGWDFVDGDRSAGDGNGHGTHVAAIAAGTAYGVAKKAEVVSVRVMDNQGYGTTSQVIAGIDWVTRHARKPAVANLSLGTRPNGQLDAAVRNSIASGVTYTVAAGNRGRPAGLASPAGVGQAITVGATGPTDARAGFSNYGAAVDLFAPGVSITSASHRGDTATAVYSGTSMASPHAAGAAALYLSGHLKASPASVARALVKGAVSGKVSGRGLGSPNRLLQVPRS